MLDRFKKWGRKPDGSPDGLTQAESDAADAEATVEADAVPVAADGEATGNWWAGLTRGKPAANPAEAKAGWLERLKVGLSKTRNSLVGQMQNLFKSRDTIDDDFWDDLEAILLQADVGTQASDRIIGDLKATVKEKKITRPLDLQLVLRDDLSRLVGQAGGTLNYQTPGPTVVMVVGVNGTGKTTSLAKLAFFLRMQGNSVMLAAADTFRAAAIEQLQIWADRLNVPIIKHKDNADPAAVVFDAITAAKARNIDVLLIDTAGRLHSKVNLMEELKKMWRVLGRELPGAPHECLLVLDATTGQNAMIQAKTFKQAVNITGVVLTKMDGTARGGVIISIAEELKVPVKFIGIGEAMDDLHEFSGEDFVDALFLQAARADVAVLLALCALPATADTKDCSIGTGGVTRTYRIHVPPNLPPHPALVLCLHGGGSNGRQMERFTRFDGTSDSNGFLVVYPDALNKNWNDGRVARGLKSQAQGVDDVAFLGAVIDQVGREYHVDMSRVYATGISNGGFMSERLAMDLSDRMAAIAPVAGGLGGDQTFHALRPVSVLMINGTGDPIVPYTGGALQVLFSDRGTVQPVENLAREWAQRDGCKTALPAERLPDTNPGDGCTVDRTTWDGGRDGTEVVLYRINGGGHTWPGAAQYLPRRMIGSVCRDFNANEVIWHFFGTHHR